MEEAVSVCAGASEQTDLYQNLPLESDSLNARILEILPGDHSQPVKCRLFVRQICGLTQYEALSYTWGTSGSTHTIEVNNQPVFLTANLECALRRLRRKTRARRVWCDAICINQLDLEERATQVTKMGQIYRNAEQVLIWLGDGNENTAIALKYIHWCINVGGCKFVEAIVHTCSPEWGWWNPDTDRYFPGFACPKCGADYEREESNYTRARIKSGLADVSRRPWWQRIWVVQEVAMAAGDPLVGCGDTWLPWSTFVKYGNGGYIWPGDRNSIAQIHSIRADIKTPLRLRGAARPLRYSSEAAAADDVFHWLRRTANFKSTDPRDKVYALLGMARNKRWREFRPNYALPVRELQHELVSHMILSDKNLDILTLCRPIVLPQQPNVLTIQEYDSEGPTWIPDFHTQGLPYLATMEHLGESSPLRILMETLPSMEAPSIDDSRTTLTASGYQVDSIDHVRPGLREVTNFSYETLDDYADALKSVYYWLPVLRAIDTEHLRTRDDVDFDEFTANASKYLKDDQFVKTLDNSIIQRHDALIRMPDGHDRDFLAAEIEQIEKEVQTKKVDLYNRARNIISSPLGRAFHPLVLPGRKFFVTRQGLLGIGPAELEFGDIFAVLNGSSAAYALRQIDTSYVLVGNVFLDTPFDSLPWTDPTPDKHSWDPAKCVAKVFKIR